MDATYVTRWTREVLESDKVSSNGRRTALGYMLLALEQKLPSDAYGRSHVISSKKGLAHCLRVSEATAMKGRTELLNAGFLTVMIAGIQRRSWGKPMRVVLTIPVREPGTREFSCETEKMSMIACWEGNPVGLHQKDGTPDYVPDGYDYPEESLEEG